MIKPEKSTRNTTITYSISCYIMLAIYITLLTIGYFLNNYLDSIFKNDIYKMLILNFILTFIAFIFSLIVQNPSVYDPYWSVAPLFMVLDWIYQEKSSENLMSQRNFVETQYSLIIFLVIIFALQHLIAYFAQWDGFSYHDFRPLSFKQKINNDLIYWPFCLISFHIMPGFMIVSGTLPLYYVINCDNYPNSLLFYGGFALAIFSIIIEGIADFQLYQWRKNNHKKSINKGLWKYSRHPNYLGEILSWFSIFIMGLACDAPVWTGIGAFIIWIIIYIPSTNMMEDRLVKRRPDYLNYQKSVSRLLLWPNKPLKLE